MNDIVLSTILSETGQGPDPRQSLIARLEKKLGRCVVTFFTSFNYPVAITGPDAEMIEDVLRTCDLSNGLSLILSSPGGDALAAEKIIRVCRVYSKDDFEVIVPSRAMSAATMICLGANKIHMLPSAELGAVDPQVIEEVRGQHRMIPARTIVDTYTKLMEQALATPADNVSPLLQQLERYDQRLVAENQNATDLSTDIAVKALSNGMMKDKTEEDIKCCIARFISPPKGQAHGRGIAPKEAKDCGLLIEEIDADSDTSKILWKLYVRTNYFVSTAGSKTVETGKQSFTVSAPSVKEQED